MALSDFFSSDIDRRFGGLNKALGRVGLPGVPSVTGDQVGLPAGRKVAMPGEVSYPDVPDRRMPTAEFGTDPFGGNFASVDTWTTDDIYDAAKLLLLDSDVSKLRSLQSTLGLLTGKDLSTLIVGGMIKVDLVIRHVNWAYADHSRVVPHLGDTFSSTFFGKAPIQLTVSGTLFDTIKSNGKQVLSELYTKVFRLKAVAKYGIAPVISFRGCSARGAMLGIDFNETSASEDTIDVNFNFLVLAMAINSPNNKGKFTTLDINYNATAGLRPSEIADIDWGPMNKIFKGVSPQEGAQRSGDNQTTAAADIPPIFGR